jgi:hypothetical protein
MAAHLRRASVLYGSILEIKNKTSHRWLIMGTNGIACGLRVKYGLSPGRVQRKAEGDIPDGLAGFGAAVWKGGKRDCKKQSNGRGAIVTTVMPEGEAIRRAIKWISAELSENPETPASKYVNETILKFDLSPAEADFLIRFYKGEQSRRTELD